MGKFIVKYKVPGTNISLSKTPSREHRANREVRKARMGPTREQGTTKSVEAEGLGMRES